MHKDLGMATSHAATKKGRKDPVAQCGPSRVCNEQVIYRIRWQLLISLMNC